MLTLHPKVPVDHRTDMRSEAVVVATHVCSHARTKSGCYWDKGGHKCSCFVVTHSDVVVVAVFGISLDSNNCQVLVTMLINEVPAAAASAVWVVGAFKTAHSSAGQSPQPACCLHCMLQIEL